MSTSYFYLHASENATNSFLIKSAEQYANQTATQVYIIDAPLGDSRYSYAHKNHLILLIPKHKIMVVNLEEESEEFDDFYLDLLEGLGSISDKFRYKEAIGRPREWKKQLVSKDTVNENTFDFKTYLSGNKIEDSGHYRRGELIISLFTGSINDIKSIDVNTPETLLEKIKKKIILFDGDQTRFIYQKPSDNRTTIQGLSGTGKTELLLHKLKEIYVGDKKSRVALTCHNKILSRTLKDRIPNFFTFMKVEEQIKWDSRLWCFNAWGSENQQKTGLYAYICKFYDIKFYN
jgi:superfamily I DNA and RNA helicase